MLIVIAIVALGVWWQFGGKESPKVTSFEECAAAGNPVMESYPRQCRHDGQTFVESIGSGNPDSQTVTAEFNKPVVMRVNDKVAFGDGLVLGIKEINDSRCKPDVVCIWQGELAAVLTLSNGKFASSSEEIRLGTVNNKSVSSKGYIFSLESATENSVTIIVSLASVATGSSGLAGYIHMGPVCPVEKIPPDPNCADKPYQTLVAVFRKSDPVHAVALTKSDAKGMFSVSLPSGEYTVGAGESNLPRCGQSEATVTQNKFTNMDISCDTGIR